MLHMIGHIIFGLIVGIVAKLLVPGHQPGGFITTALLGIAGGWLGGFIGRVMGLYPEGHPAGFFMAVLGAVILIVIYMFAVGGRRTTAEVQGTHPVAVTQVYSRARSSGALPLPS